MTPSRLVLLVLLAFGAACSSTVDGVCEDITEACSDPIDEAACKHEGAELEEVAENLDCDDVFEAHLDCIDESGCAWEARCAETLDVLLRCVS